MTYIIIIFSTNWTWYFLHTDVHVFVSFACLENCRVIQDDDIFIGVDWGIAVKLEYFIIFIKKTHSHMNRNRHTHTLTHEYGHEKKKVKGNWCQE